MELLPSYARDTGDVIKKVDVLMIWYGSEKELLTFAGILNNNSKNIKLTMKYIKDKVDFLDVIIFKDARGQIQMDMFRKETAVNALLHATSSHLAPTTIGIPTGQFLRVQRISSQNDLFYKQVKDLT